MGHISTLKGVIIHCLHPLADYYIGRVISEVVNNKLVGINSMFPNWVITSSCLLLGQLVLGPNSVASQSGLPVKTRGSQCLAHRTLAQ